MVSPNYEAFFNGQALIESASIGSDKWRATGYLSLVHLDTIDSNGWRFLYFFLNLFLPCHPSSGITVIQVCPFQPKNVQFAVWGPCRGHRHTDGYFTTTCHALRSSCTSPAFRKGHSIAAKLGWLDQKSIDPCNLQQTQSMFGCFGHFEKMTQGWLVLRKIHHDNFFCFITLEQIGCRGLPKDISEPWGPLCRLKKCLF